MRCTYKRETKKRGPPNKVVIQILAEQAAEDSAAVDEEPGPSRRNESTGNDLQRIRRTQIRRLTEIVPLSHIRIILSAFFDYCRSIVPLPHRYVLWGPQCRFHVFFFRIGSMS